MVNFKDFDLFGTKIEFNLNGQDKYKSTFGAFCSIIYLSSIVLIGAFCVKDFFDTKNSNVSYTYKNKALSSRSEFVKNITNDNFFFALQIFNQDYNTVLKRDGNGKQVIYPVPVYSHGEIDPATGLHVFKNRRLNFKNCTKDILGNTEGFEFLLNYLCIDFEDVKIGGSWTDNFIDLFTLFIKTCDVIVKEDADVFTLEKDNFNCSEEDDVSNAITKSYIDIYFSGYKLDLNKNNISAFTRHISNIYEFLDLVQYRSSELFIQESTFIDDHGYFLDSPLSTEQNIILSQGDYLDYSAIILPRIQERYIYKVGLHYSETEYIIARRQTRLQDLIANIMGIIGIVELLLGNIADYYNSTMINVNVINKLFTFCEDNEENNNQNINENINEKNDSKIIPYHKVNIKESSKSFQQGQESKNHLNLNSNYHSNRCLNEQNNDEVVNIEVVYKNNYIEHNNKSIENNIANNVDNINPLDKESNYSINNTKPKIKQNSYELFLNNVDKKNECRKKNKLDLKFLELINLFCCKNNLKEKEKKILNVYEIGLKYIEERTDIMYLFDIYKQIELGKSIFLKENLSFLLNSLKKPNLYSKIDYNGIKSLLINNDDENILDGQDTIIDNNQRTFNKLLLIKEFLNKAKISNVDSANSGGLSTYDNLQQLLKEIKPEYQEVIMTDIYVD